jgi:hypothetical protein
MAIAKSAAADIRPLRKDAQIELALNRLARFVDLERRFGPELNDAGQRLVRLSTFSVFCEARRLGVERRAGTVLRDGSAALAGTRLDRSATTSREVVATTS